MHSRKTASPRTRSSIFATDNGPWLSYGDHAGSAGPLREGKGTCWEGGVRVPCIMRWPGHIPAKSTSNAMLMTIDLFPTISRLVGAELPKHPIDGLDVWPLLAGEAGATNPHDAYVYYYEQNQLQAVVSGDGRWKLQLPHTYRTLAGHSGGHDGPRGIYRSRKRSSTELYDLTSDLGETTDVASLQPDIVKRLLAVAERARDELGDSLTKREGGASVRQGSFRLRKLHCENLLHHRGLGYLRVRFLNDGVGVLCLGAVHLGRRAACGSIICVVTSLFYLAVRGCLPFPHVADRRHRNLSDLSPVVDSPELWYPAPMARIRPYRSRLLCLAGGAIGWVADHRNHHAHSDGEHDVHSPNRGFAWAHMLWWMTPEVICVPHPAVLHEVGSRPVQGPGSPLMDKYQIVFPLSVVRGLVRSGRDSWLIWGGLSARLRLHTTWLVNSATHVWGYRSLRHARRLDESTGGSPC